MKGAQDRRWNPTPNRRFAWTPTWTPLATALYARTDDLLKTHPEWVPSRPKVGIAPRISDAELVTMALMQALLGFTSEARWLRHARAHRGHLFPYLPQQPGYNKRLRRLAGTLNWLTGILALDTNVWTDDVWVVDSTPIECARSRDTVKRSDLAGWAEYGYCASHSRYFWGVRLHLVATLQGLPIGFVITGAKADERQVLLDLLHDDPTLAASRPGQTLIADKNYYGRDFEHDLARRGIQLLRRARKGEPERPGGRYFKRAIRITAVPGPRVSDMAGNGQRQYKSLCQRVSYCRHPDSPLLQTTPPDRRVDLDTVKGQLGLEQHGGHSSQGVLVRILQRILAMTTAIWHNDQTGQPVRRSLLAYDH